MSYASWTCCSQEELWKSASPTGDITGALKYIQNQNMAKHLRECRQAVARVNPRPEEFLAITVLMFFDEMSSNEEIERIGDKYRKLVLNERYATYYRDKLQLKNYASRLGELMLLLQVFDKKSDLQEQVEVLWLFNVVPEDNFIYSLQKE
ncbi:hypothetical protein PENTCL1PPCAC_14209 [Pristionchus entomophagus]|uniref:NR LBD domain-containing protein n=1 Tax=Pristionchus entomophagus TaxID=358040 RepID=A0AAV5TDA1_9BILA|nr:hypothetical protein PENTCL1PPCAC_14209 [Pristionchus entomophagus]